MWKRLIVLSVLAVAGCNKGEAAKPASNAPVAVQAPAPVASNLVTRKGDAGHRDFNHAKKALPEIFAGMEEEFYCGCKYSGKDVDFKSCGFEPRKNANRAARIEWEHVFPAEHFGRQQQCWKDGGRKNCSGKDTTFDTMEGDLNNLVPAVGEVNGDRNNFSYSVWTNNPTPVYGQCKSIPDFQSKKFQPREEVRGRAGRISLYMATHYGLQVSKQDKQLWCAWAKQYPVDAWEIERDKRIKAMQGEGNPLVEDKAELGKVCG